MRGRRTSGGRTATDLRLRQDGHLDAVDRRGVRDLDHLLLPGADDQRDPLDHRAPLTQLVEAHMSHPGMAASSSDDPGPTTGWLEICKNADPAGPVSGPFTFSVTDGDYSSTETVTTGTCTAPFQVPTGTATVTENAMSKSVRTRRRRREYEREQRDCAPQNYFLHSTSIDEKRNNSRPCSGGYLTACRRWRCCLAPTQLCTGDTSSWRPGRDVGVPARHCMRRPAFSRLADMRFRATTRSSRNPRFSDVFA